MTAKRPYRSVKTKRNKFLAFRVFEEDFEKIKECYEKDGVSCSQFCEDIVMKVVNRRCKDEK